ncbi:MAG TPA: PH domain-containing protein [Sphingomicrobium sp.]
MSELTSPDDPAVGAPERLHPLFLLTGLAGSLRGLIGGYAAIGYLAVSGRWLTALYGAIGLLVALSIGTLLYWRRFEFRVGQSEIRIDSGIISRTHRSIPFDRIHDVDITQGPVSRLFGVARVKFETGSAAAGSDEGMLQAIPLQRAEDLRALVRSRRSGAPSDAAATVTESEDQPPVFAMPMPRLILAGLFNFSLAIFAGLFGLSQTAGDVIGFDPLSRRFWRDLLDAGSPIAAYILAHQVITIVAGLIVLLLVGAATGIVRTVLRDFRFRLDRTGIGLRRRRGLFTKTDVTLPSRRVQAAVLSSGPVRERFGWRELHVQSLASDEGSKGDHVVAPLASEGEADHILDALGWRGVAGFDAWQPVAIAYVWTFAIAATPLLVAAGINAGMETRVAGLLVAAYAVLLAGRWLAWRRTRWSIDGDRLLLASGWWRRRIIILPIAKLQSIDLVETLVSRLFGTATLLFGVAGGRGFSAHRLVAVPRETARTLRDRLLG